MIKAQPVDVVVVIGGYDKTVPAQVMGSLSANKPVLPLVVGPMMTGSFRGQRIGACTDCRNNWAAYRAAAASNASAVRVIAAISRASGLNVGRTGLVGSAGGSITRDVAWDHPRGGESFPVRSYCNGPIRSADELLPTPTAPDSSVDGGRLYHR